STTGGSGSVAAKQLEVRTPLVRLSTSRADDVVEQCELLVIGYEFGVCVYELGFGFTGFYKNMGEGDAIW
ncbi:hypothetical protein Tco_0912801, partial [Tanacetum coccineum]